MVPEFEVRNIYGSLKIRMKFRHIKKAASLTQPYNLKWR